MLNRSLDDGGNQIRFRELTSSKGKKDSMFQSIEVEGSWHSSLEGMERGGVETVLGVLCRAGSVQEERVQARPVMRAAAAKSTLYVSTQLAFSQRACTSVNFFFLQRKHTKLKSVQSTALMQRANFHAVSLGRSTCFLTVAKRAYLPLCLLVPQSPGLCSSRCTAQWPRGGDECPLGLGC